MKKIVFIVMFLLMFASSVLAAEPMQYEPVFECRAYSYYAVGFGYAGTSYLASRIALNECAMRTPVGYVCVIDWCRQVR